MEDKTIEERLNPIKDLRFTITKDMEDTIIRMLVIQQMLNESKLSLKDEILLKKEKGKLLKSFIKDFQALNMTQVSIVRTFLNN